MPLWWHQCTQDEIEAYYANTDTAIHLAYTLNQIEACKTGTDSYIASSTQCSSTIYLHLLSYIFIYLDPLLSYIFILISCNEWKSSL